MELEYRKEIDGLRAFAILAVLLFHSGISTFQGGYLGVDVFFVISGYLITSQILTGLESGNFQLLGFYKRRAIRLLPALLFLLLVCFLYGRFILLPYDMRNLSEYALASLSFSVNILSFFRNGYFDTSAELKPLFHLWSLSLEEQFYLLYPCLILLVGRKRLVPFLVGLTLLSFASVFVGSEKFNFYFLPARLWELSLGCLVAIRLKESSPFQEKRALRELLSWMGLAFILIIFFTIDRNVKHPGPITLLPTLGTVLILSFVRGTSLSKLLSIQPLATIGMMSYGLYLWHQAVFAFARVQVDNIPPERVPYLILLTFLLAGMSWKFIERPARKVLQQQRKSFLILSGAACFVVAAGIEGIATDGLQSRFDPRYVGVMYAQNNGRHHRCDEESARLPGPTCTLGDEGVPPSIALLGDSHSARLTKILDEVLREKKLAAIVYSKSWCAPLNDIGTSVHIKSPDCREFMDHALKQVIADDKISSVILHAQWANFTKGQRWQDHYLAFYTDQFSRNPGLPENKEVLKRSLTRTGSALKSAGKKVFLIKSIPEYETNVLHYLGRQVVRKESVVLAPELLIDRKKYEERNKEVHEAMEAARVQDWAQLIDPFESLCRTGVCEYQDESNRVYYFDSNHLTYEGARIVGSQLFKILFSDHQQTY